ncbi:hypothetical protein [Ruminococcus flavefaciens]|uniref:Uncharacterized protein n=1 Tax=Ruminococcus flavefaciens TaxID=1265 RepID=A0A1M7HSI4_RUMFL|nr:hypothetical protein [Ruminococcus flavefaciens]MBR6984810.1 hypothetical protein [Ruminococcus sp.]SHM31444.1 hypothetical protein SAMN04487860_10369 [Ruminococcus flavefaciens]
MGKSWELTDDQKKEIEQRSREIAAQYDPETGKKKNAVDNVDNPDDDEVEGMENGRQRKIDDDNIR